ncbi:MAG: hypothetical protein JO340_08495 [Acidobacteriaceae bacterium]|nr:hypothetical protein [Acidobacteriaceae bacterium]
MLLRAACVALLLVFAVGAQDTPKPSSSNAPNPAAPAPEAPPIPACPAGAPLGAVDLRVYSPQNSDALPFRTIIHLSEEDTLRYSPLLRGREKRPGEIALVMVPAKIEPGKPMVVVTDPVSAAKPQQWKIPETVSLAAFVYGPEGLSKRKVRNFLSQDNVLIAQLADYADKTAQTEALVQALSNAESSSNSVNAALTGFASQYGFAVQLDRNAPPAEQAETLFASMNPQLAAYNPLTPSTAVNIGQTASLATAAATLFFGSPIGLATGGAAMLLDLRAIAFPDTQFRSSFAEPLAQSGVNLCGQQTPAPPHTRIAYIWASRIPNMPLPAIHIEKSNFIPAGQKSPLPVELPDPEWKYLQRARLWTLQSGAVKSAVTVLKLGNQKALELDLAKAALPAGDYRLTAYWDWVPFAVSGLVHVLPLSDFKHASLIAASQDSLVAKSGKIPVTLSGGDFEFTTKVQVKKLNDEFATAQPVPFVLPKGLREGPQDRMDVQIDTGDLDPGEYALLIAQQDGKPHPVDFKILPNPPKIDNLPILANQGVAIQHYVLKGERLDELTRLAASNAVLELGAAAGNGGERNLTVQLKSNLQPGASLAVQAFMKDRSEPLSFPDALQITGPLPLIASSKLSLPVGMAIATRPSEFPAGYNLTAMLDVKNIARSSTLQLACADAASPGAALHIGEQTSAYSLQQLSQDQLFLSFDTGALPAGCSLQAIIDNGRAGKSQPFPLAQIVRLPQIDSFQVSADPAPAPPASAMRAYTLTGRNLEMIEKAGWDQSNGLDVSALPVPIAGQGQLQSLAVTLPEQSGPPANLYIWLRGDTTGRATTLKNPVPSTVPTPAPPAAPSPASPL